MSYLKIYQKDFKVILSVASILPVVCFIGGFYTAWSRQPQQSVSETLSEAQVAEQDDSIAVRSEVDDLYANQNGDVSEEGLNQNAGLPEENDSQRSESEHKYTLPNLNVSSLQSFNEYLVQAGRFSSYENAAEFQSQLTGKNLPSRIVLDDSAEQPAFLIIVTSFTNKDEAKRYCHLAEELYQLDFYVKAREVDLQKPSESFASL